MTETIRERVLDFFLSIKQVFRGWVRQLTTPIKNIILWYPILKEDQQWDNEYLYEIIKHKLKLMEDFHRSDKSHTANSEDYADEMREVIDALDRLIENDYMPKEFNEYFDSLLRANIDVFNRPALTLTEREEHLKWYNEEAENRRKDMELVFNSLRDKSEAWWD